MYSTNSKGVNMKYQKVVVAIDLASESDKILNIARNITEGSLDSLHAVYVMELPPTSFPYDGYLPLLEEAQARISRDSAQQLNTLADRVEIPLSNQRLLRGHPANEICEYALRTDAQLVVIGNHSALGEETLLDSTANRVVQQASCDVLTVRVSREKDI
ncbi:MAG: universal stress protein A [Pseudohongiellaceae bacterium]|jgi:universal stress protein A